MARHDGPGGAKRSFAVGPGVRGNNRRGSGANRPLPGSGRRGPCPGLGTGKREPWPSSTSRCAAPLVKKWTALRWTVGGAGRDPGHERRRRERATAIRAGRHGRASSATAIAKPREITGMQTSDSRLGDDKGSGSDTPTPADQDAGCAARRRAPPARAEGCERRRPTSAAATAINDRRSSTTSSTNSTSSHPKCAFCSTALTA